MAVPTGIEPAISCVTGRHVNRYTTGPFWLRGPDLNQRPSGYEPDELPLLHPALILFITLLLVRIAHHLSTFFKMEEVEGFEPPRGLTRLSVFKTDPFSRTWVYLHAMI